MYRLVKIAIVAAAAAILPLESLVIQTGATATAQDVGQRYVPGIWVDPDGCEHWVMDDGLEGYMTPHVTRDGIPVCRRGNPCLIMNSDQLFKVDKHYINAWGRKHLMQFFQSSGATAYIIDGHTDSDASDSYNMRLSERRARAVAQIAAAAGQRAQVRWYGERVPRATNRTAAGKKQNRRVEITCIR